MTCTHKHTCTHAHMCICTQMHMYTHIHTHAHTLIHIQACTHARTCTHMHSYTYKHMHTHMHSYTYTRTCNSHTYTHTHTHIHTHQTQTLLPPGKMLREPPLFLCPTCMCGFQKSLLSPGSILFRRWPRRWGTKPVGPKESNVLELDANVSLNAFTLTAEVAAPPSTCALTLPPV